MSINAMTNAAVARREDFHPAGGPPQGLAGIALAAGTPPAPIVPAPPGSNPPPPPPPANGANTALQTLTTYIPTEILTLYVAAIAALATLPADKDGHQDGRWAPFYAFLVATPLLVWIAFATKLKSAGKPIPLSPRLWPVWEMCAATAAFVAWVFALPNTPFAQFKEVYSAGFAGFMVLVVSSGLGMIAPLMQRRLPA